MTPRAGGEADKLGNQYEFLWAVRHALYCLADDKRSLTYEDPNTDFGEGSEFTYKTESCVEVHQVKRQNGIQSNWSIRRLIGLEVFDAARHHVSNGREFHFVSTVPPQGLKELCRRSQRAKNVRQFTAAGFLSKELQEQFDILVELAFQKDQQQAWQTLRGMKIRIEDEDTVVQTNAIIASSLLEGANGENISSIIGDILISNLGIELNHFELVNQLHTRKIYLRGAESQRSSIELIEGQTAKWANSIKRDMLRPSIKRREVAEILRKLQNHKIVLVSGTAGGGKSAVLEQVVEELQREGKQVLALRLDRIDNFVSTIDLGSSLGLDASPAVVLSRAKGKGNGYLVIDQLDAVSLVSGRAPERFDIVVDLIDEVRRLNEKLELNEIKVVLACREFDIRNDHRIQSLVDENTNNEIQVNLLTDEEINDAVSAMDLDSTKLTPTQRSILRTPLHLVLLKSLANHGDPLEFHSKNSLFDKYWDRKRTAIRTKGRNIRFEPVLNRVASIMSGRQMLSIPAEFLDEDDLIDDAQVLVSEHVLALEDNKIGFFHENFFDYTFARLWFSKSESLVDFLRQDEQELFRRGQVRQILQYLYERDPYRFRQEVKSALSSEYVRFHIKKVILAVLASLEAPSCEDAAIIFDVSENNPKLQNEIWANIQSTPWFKRFLEDGKISKWIDSGDPALQDRAISLMAEAVRDLPDEVAGVLYNYRSMPHYFTWICSVSRYADLSQSRNFFDLVLDAVRKGHFNNQRPNLWFTASQLPEQKPLWALELLKAQVTDSVDAFKLSEAGRIQILCIRDYHASKFVKKLAEKISLPFVQTFIPYLREVMETTKRKPNVLGCIKDPHFHCYFDTQGVSNEELGLTLFMQTVFALRSLADSKPDEIQLILEELAQDPYEASQLLLYQAMAAGERSFSKLAVEILLTGGKRLICEDQVVDQLVKAISPHISENEHNQLEILFRDLSGIYKGRNSSGKLAYRLLSSLEEKRLTSVGIRKLGEYRRKFEKDQSDEDFFVKSGTISSPIRAEKAARMPDDNWLKAMQKHNADRMTIRENPTGGAGELSEVLRDQVAANPERFAKLALRFTPNLNPKFAIGILRGLSDATPTDETASLVFEAVRHLASLGHDDIYRFLDDALSHYYGNVPIDIFELLLQRTLDSLKAEKDTSTSTGVNENQTFHEDMFFYAINTIRGSLVYSLARMLMSDVTGERTNLIRPHLVELAEDPVLEIRSMVAGLLLTVLNSTQAEVISAFEKLIDTDDRIFTDTSVQALLIRVEQLKPETITPLIERMFISTNREARKAGGEIAAVCGFRWGRTDLLERALNDDSAIREGVAETCVNFIGDTSKAGSVSKTLIRLMEDEEENVLKAITKIAPSLRGKPLRPHAELLNRLIDSPAYPYDVTQLLFTLESAPDNVDDFILKASQRFISEFRSEITDPSSHVPFDALHVGELLIRALTQSQNTDFRGELLDVLDEILELNVYGVEGALADVERS
ncbi:hypothetical protein CMUST_11710 [Corynebacterium mustelae]|uniref:ATP-binding protein n=1 Tax=Corynebacterium mustelae TaxID=571915 RepID=A0A0G3H4C2_9CORY|nr:ATP-binding protein [Corynebacterium mustelae]AKK06653.1 hypothetical protein CMUST_11710 [Corynebacterium mustelae]